MLKLSLIEFLIRGIPEAFLIIFAVYLFSKTKVIFKNYLLASLAYAITVYMIRLFPILFGVNLIIGIMVDLAIVIFICKIDIVRAISAVITAIILLVISEGLNVFMIQFILRKDIKDLFSEPLLKTLYGIPSLIFFGVIVVIVYILFNRKGLKYVSDNENF